MSDTLTDADIERHLREIDSLTQLQCARIHRFAPLGHPYFREPLYSFFKKHFELVGGMTPEISKSIGWEKS